MISRRIKIDFKTITFTECDGTMHYLNDSMLATLDSCYNQYKVNGICGRSECAEPFSSYQAVLKTCNCYHTYLHTGTDSDTTESCLGNDIAQ